MAPVAAKTLLISKMNLEFIADSFDEYTKTTMIGAKFL
jgi:dynein heavy chain